MSCVNLLSCLAKDHQECNNKQSTISVSEEPDKAGYDFPDIPSVWDFYVKVIVFCEPFKDG